MTENESLEILGYDDWGDYRGLYWHLRDFLLMYAYRNGNYITAMELKRPKKTILCLRVCVCWWFGSLHVYARLCVTPSVFPSLTLPVYTNDNKTSHSLILVITWQHL